MDVLKRIGEDRATEQHLEALLSAGSKEVSVRGTGPQISDAEFELLAVLCRQMQAYYPHQEFCEDTVQGYMFDFERLAARHGIAKLREAFLNLRIRPGQRFFPHPVDVVEEIEAMHAAERRKRPIVPNRHLLELAEAKAVWERERAEAMAEKVGSVDQAETETARAGV